MTDPSFFHAIFKRLQGVAAAHGAHQNADNDPNAGQFYGGFTLRRADSQFGIFGGLSSAAPTWGFVQGNKSLRDNDTTPADNPLWAMLNASLQTKDMMNPPVSVPVPPDNQVWPSMPFPSAGETVATEYPEWIAVNPQGGLTVIDALKTWIANGKLNDVPKSAPIDSATLDGLAKPKFPLKNSDNGPILFVASFKGDDGRRADDNALPNPPAVPFPPQFWNSSQIFITDTTGAFPANLTHLAPHANYYVMAVIGNSSTTFAGSMSFSGQTLLVQGDALAFNSFMGPNVPLYSLGELNAASTNPSYEQFYLPIWSYDVVGFRFDVDDVFTRLVTEVAKLPPAMIFNELPEKWVRDGHPCVKIRIMAGEAVNNYTPWGAVPDIKNSTPPKDRHIAQRNLAHFDPMQMKKAMWKNFIVAQAGAGVNGLSLQHALPLKDFQVYLAIPRLPYDRYIANGGAMRGFELLREAASFEEGGKPFPGETVFLRQTNPIAEIRIADHTKDEYFGMALGLEGDPARLKGVRNTDISMAHAGADHHVGGGFTVRLGGAQ